MIFFLIILIILIIYFKNVQKKQIQLEEQQTEKEAQNASFFDEETIKNIYRRNSGNDWGKECKKIL